MILIGISGKKGSGKTTVANYLQELFHPLTVEHHNFADSLKDEICRACNISRNYLEEHKDNFRLIMQGWGTDYKRKLVSETYWLEKYMVRTLKSSASVILTSDVRFINEYSTIHDSSGILIRIDRTTEVRDEHPSECELDLKQFDHHIINDGSLVQLKEKVKQIHAQLVK